MKRNTKEKHYTEILEHIQTFFPTPFSDPIMDGYFTHTISHFLDHVDNLKCVAPILGIKQEECPTCKLQSFDKENPSILSGIEQQGQFGTAQIQDFPEHISSVESVTETLADYCQGMTLWGHPNTQANVVPPPTVPSIVGFIAAAMYSPNIIWDEYSALFAKAEIQVVSMLSNLIGYDSQKSGGLFTFGGTGTNLYGCKLGIEKMLGGTGMTEGIREDVKIVSSESSHYSRYNIASWLGVGTKNLVTIPSTHKNEMSLTDLEDYLRKAFEEQEKVAVILPTLGTTDAFGIDDLAAIVQLRDRLAYEFSLEKPPHIHADAVIGWPWSVFNDYDFETNPLGYHARTLRSLQDSSMKIKSLHMADSIGIDFHKTGYTPYISSVFLLKNREDMTLLSREPEQMPYLYQFGYYHPGIYTLESSRSAAGTMAALANLLLLGKQGYRVLIGHLVEMAEMLREELEQHPYICILNDYNYGPVTLFRIYPDGVDAKKAYEQEMSDPNYRDELEENNTYNRHIFDKLHEQAMRGEGVLLSWTDAYRHADYPDGLPIAAIKSFIMSPWTDMNSSKTLARQVADARIQIKETEKST